MRTFHVLIRKCLIPLTNTRSRINSARILVVLMSTVKSRVYWYGTSVHYLESQKIRGELRGSRIQGQQL